MRFIFKTILFLSVVWTTSAFENDYPSNFDKTVKTALREVGHELLLQSQDSTSVVKPILKLDGFRYELSFANNLVMDPGSIVYTIYKALEKANLPQDYLIEVIKCNDREVAYSFKQSKDDVEDIIPCSGRLLPKECYTIELTIQEQVIKSESSMGIIWIINLSLFTLLIIGLYIRLKLKHNDLKNALEDDGTNLNYRVLGQFVFYPEQNVLIRSEEEIELSKKECEILAILSERPNEIVKREELSKRVWEDQGVVVGRSLDTYISKLRKKLKDDSSIKLTNVHGVGYKLEVR